MFLKKLYFQRTLSLADKFWRPSRTSVEGTDLLSCRHPAGGSHEGRQWLEGHHWAVDQHLPEVHPDPSFLIIGANRFPLLFGNKQKTKFKQIQRTAFWLGAWRGDSVSKWIKRFQPDKIHISFRGFLRNASCWVFFPPTDDISRDTLMPHWSLTIPHRLVHGQLPSWTST